MTTMRLTLSLTCLLPIAAIAATAATAAEPAPPAKAASAAKAATAPSGESPAQTDVRRKPYTRKQGTSATGPGTQTEDDVYVGVRKK